MISIYKGILNQGALSQSSISSDKLNCEFLENEFLNVINKQLKEIVHIKW